MSRRSLKKTPSPRSATPRLSTRVRPTLCIPHQTNAARAGTTRTVAFVKTAKTNNATAHGPRPPNRPARKDAAKAIRDLNGVEFEGRNLVVRQATERQR